MKTLQDLIVDPVKPIEAWPDVHVLACTIFGESRGEKLECKLAVGCVIRNRVHSPVSWWGTDWRSVCLKPWQFSCWNEGDPNRVKLWRPLEFEPAYVWLDCLSAARVVMEPGLQHDLTYGADHYYDVSLDRIGKPPYWAAKYKLARRIGRIKFFRSK